MANTSKTVDDLGGTLSNQRIVVLDFGGQYNELIARRVREANVYCEVIPYFAPLDRIATANLAGIILTGGPDSVYLPDAKRAEGIFALGVPELGICYGCHLLAHRARRHGLQGGCPRIRTHRDCVQQTPLV